MLGPSLRVKKKLKYPLPGDAASILTGGHILGQKRNAAYKTYILYGVYFINLSQTICHSLSADSLIMSSWGCPGYRSHRTK